MSEQGADPLDALVRANDLDGLVALVGRWCDDQRWDDLVRLRARCRSEATETGRQLWPAAALAEYRLALDAPGPWAAAMVVEATGRFVAGPLTEVAAARHRWQELAPHLGHDPAAVFVAHERVLRGEDLRGAGLDPTVLEVPFVLLDWEPPYALADYADTEATFPSPPPPGGLSPVDLPGPGPQVDDLDVDHALRELALGWLTGSDASLAIATVEGDHLGALAALLAGPATMPLADTVAPIPATQVLTAPAAPAAAMAWLAWAGATGGVHGRRRGAATGRFGAWWTAAALAGVDWPDLPADRAAAEVELAAFGGLMGDAVHELRWWWWEPDGPTSAWSLRLAVEDPVDAVAWAFELVDRS